MQRTEYFNQTRPPEDVLDWTEDSKISAIRRRLLASAQMGVKNGFEVTINIDASKIDIAHGEGYTGGSYLVNTFTNGTIAGERISTFTDTPSGEVDRGAFLATAQGLASYVAGVKNYVSIVYHEDSSYSLAERSYPFTAHDTVYIEHYTVSVLDETDWLALSSADLSNRVLIAIITSSGLGTIAAADIDQFVQPQTHPYASQPHHILGVTINNISDVSPLGISTLTWMASSSTLYWTANPDTIGAGVVISTSGSYTLYSNNTNYHITVSVIYATLAAIVSQSESIQIQSLYGRKIPMFCANDQIHRDMIGTGNQSPINPHATSLNDISGGGFDHADLFHVNGISVDAEDTQLQCTAYSGPDRVEITNIGTFSNSFLIDGVTLLNLSGVAPGAVGTISFDTTPAPAAGDYLIYVESDGSYHSVLIAGYVAGSAPEWPLWSTNIQIIDMHNLTAGNGTISWNATTLKLTYQAPGDGAPGVAVHLGDQDYAGYYKIYSSDAGNENWIIVNVIGSLGAINSSTFTVTKDESSYADENILKLCVVNWTGEGLVPPYGSEQLTDVRDIRNYITADACTPFKEEHDADGHHNKVLPQPLRVAVSMTHPAIDAYNAVSWAVRGSAANYAIIGQAPGVVAGSFSAPNSALIATAKTLYAGMFTADSTAIYATAATCAVRATADTIAIRALASAYQAVSATAKSECIFAQASGDRGVIASAANYGISANANTQYGVYGQAPTDGVFGSASANTAATIYGVHGSAVNPGTAANAVGVYGEAAWYGVYGYAGMIGVCGSASSAVLQYVIGVIGTAVNPSLPAAEVGICGGVSGVGATGVWGIAAAATSGTGVVGSAKVSGIGVHGEATSAGTGVYGKAVTTGTGVYGLAVSNYGVYGLAASNYGVYGSASINYGVYGKADNQIGVYGSASTYGVKGEADETGVYGIARIYGVSGKAKEYAVFGSASDSVNGDVHGIYGTADNVSVTAKAIGVMGEVSGSAATAIYGVASDGTAIVGAGIMGGYFVAMLGGATALHIEGVPSIDVVTVAANGVYGYIPIWINGVMKRLAIYET